MICLEMKPPVNHEYYGLITGLPDLTLQKPDLAGTGNIWAQYGHLLTSHDQLLLQLAYLPVDHKLVLRSFFEQPVSETDQLLACYDSSAHQSYLQQNLKLFPYQDQMLFPDKESPRISLEASWRIAWTTFVRQTNNRLLHEYTVLQEALFLIRIMLAEDNGDAIADVHRLSGVEEPNISWPDYHRRILEATGISGQIMRLMTIRHPEELEWEADNLAWNWLEEQLFQKEFRIDRLLAYAWQQQLIARWSRIRNADAKVPVFDIDVNTYV